MNATNCTIDDSFRQVVIALSKILNSWVALGIIIVGVCLNLFSIFIFRRGDKGKTPAIHYYLITLTAWYTAVLANVFFHSIPIFFSGRTLPFDGYIFIYKAIHYTTSAAQYGSVWILVALTIDRFLALCYPIKHRVIGTRSRVKKTTIIISIAALIFALPKIFEVKISDEKDNGALQLTYTALAENNVYWFVYRVALNFLFLTICPSILLWVLTTKISIALRREFESRWTDGPIYVFIDSRRHLLASSSTDSEETRQKNKDLRVNLLLLIIILKNVVCAVLPVSLSVIRLIIGAKKFYGPLPALLYYIGDFLTYLDCSTNFFIFCIYGKKFRRTCLYVLSTSPLGKFISQRRTLEPTGSESSSNNTQKTDKAELSMVNINQLQKRRMDESQPSFSEKC